MNLVNICENCFEASIPECVENFKIGGFEANAELILYVENFQGKKNARDFTADANGVITVPYEQFGKGFFSAENSPFVFTFKSEVMDCNLLTFKQCVNAVQTDFSCLAIDFIKVNDASLFTNEINCQCPQ